MHSTILAIIGACFLATLFGHADAETTVMGCNCTSPCGASEDFGLAKCDWCYTDNKCGHYAVTRFKYYDYCVYPAKKTEQKRTWDVKHEDLWKQIVADQTPGTYPNKLGIVAESIQTSFDDHRDIMPKGRKKFIHSVGSVCQFVFKVDATSPYTGIFKPSSEARGFVRMGSAIEVDLNSGLTPGLGVKFLRTNAESGNFVALFQLDPLPGNSYNFFEKNFSNHIPTSSDFGKKILQKKFRQASNCPVQVGLSDLATFDQDGARASKPNFPFQIILEPRDVSMPSSPPVNQETIAARMNSIESGTHLFTVYAYPDPKSALSGGEPVHLGEISTTSACVSSKFGDASFFIRHQRIEEDWQLRPEWMPTIKANGEASCGSTIKDDKPPKRCSAMMAMGMPSPH